QLNLSPRHRRAEHHRFRGHVHHAGVSLAVDVGQFFHELKTERVQSSMTARISSAALSLGLTCLRLNQGSIPSKSGVTRIWPSQSLPDPMPIVGTGTRWVNSFATEAVTNSRTMAKAPAWTSVSASVSSAWCSVSFLPLIL